MPQGSPDSSMQRVRVLLVLLAATPATLALTRAQVARAKRAVEEANISSGPRFVRLAFHDCVGGCDGCINVHNADNAGFASTIPRLEEVYLGRGFHREMSRADFWALAAIHGLERTLDNANKKEGKKKKQSKHGPKRITNTSKEEQRDASSEEEFRDASSEEALRGASFEEAMRDASSEEALRDASSEEALRDASNKEAMIDASSEEELRDASSEEDLRDSSSEEKN